MRLLILESMNQRLFSPSVSSVTEGIQVSVRTTWLREESDPERDHYVFAYEITITNQSPYTVQLLRRTWHIQDAIGRKRMVKGEGVVGQKPVLAPGQAHTYVSGCNFQEPVGQMKGHFVFLRNADKGEFEVRIPNFLMELPALLN
jgi:ApaG protein